MAQVDWLTQGGTIANANAALGALGTTCLSLVTDFPFDTSCTIRNWHVHAHLYRVGETSATVIMLVVPDSMVAAVKAADWGNSATWDTYRRFLWFHHRFWFGCQATYGDMHKTIEMMPATMRTINKDETLLTLLYLEDVSNAANNYYVSSTVEYQIKENTM